MERWDRRDAVTVDAPEAGTDGDDARAGNVTAVRVRCDDCGPSVIAVSSVRLLGRRGRWEYTFVCSGCGTRIRRSADAALRAALRRAGAVELSVQRPGPAAEP